TICGVSSLRFESLLQELLDFAHELADSFQESVDSSQEIADLSQELLHDEINKTHETYKGQDLAIVNGSLPRIKKPIVFAVDDTFPDWPIAEHYIAEYGRQKGFVAIKIRSKTDHNGHLINLYYKCEFGRTVVRITSFNDHYVEHQLSLDTEFFAPVNRRFSDECNEEIHHLVVNGRCDLATIRSLISVKYPDQLFLTRDLANVVAQLQQEHKVEGNNASQLLKLLYEYKEKDPDWYIEPLIDSISNCLCGIFWMDPSQHERWIRFSQTLMPDETIESFHWVMGQLKKATGILPRILMTDEDLSMKYVSWDFDNSLNLQVTYNNDFVENIYDISQSYLLALIKENEYSSIQEIWRITCLILTRNTELAPITHQLSNATNVNLLRVDNVQEKNFQKSVNKKLQFNKSMSLAKRAITLQGDGENDNELDTFLKSYIEKKILQYEKETKEREMRVLRENYNLGNAIAIKTKNDQLISIDDVANPLHHIGKGAPKKNCIKGAQE
ncbi:24345_t:CDS:2, partial [Dentiscutata erythropus]